MKTTDLCRIMAKHGSDKSPLWKGKRKPHDYTIIYDELFSKFKNDDPMTSKVKVLEVGVYEGASLRGWREYFGWCAAIGLDKRIDRIDPDLAAKCCWQIDQTDRDAVSRWFKGWGGITLDPFEIEFQIIIDDGLHKPEGAIPFFTEAFPYLAKDGYYVVEDVKPQYMDQTLRAMENAHPNAHIDIHDRRYPGSKYDNILIIARHGNS
jgi:hypothetical protein